MDNNDKFDKISYNNEYNKNKYDSLRIVVKKGKKELLKAYAKKHGTTINGLINQYIESLPLDDKEI